MASLPQTHPSRDVRPTCRGCGVPADALLCGACRDAAVTSFLPLCVETADGSGYDAAVFEELAALEPGNFWFQSRAALISWACRRYFPDARTFLEVGCGTGFTLAAVQAAAPRLSVAGGDVHAEGLAVARRRVGDAPLFRLDARSLPFSGDFDVVGSFDVLEHIPEDVEALRALRRATDTGGGLIVTVPQHRWLWSATDDVGRHQRRYSRGELVAKLRQARFEPVRVTSFVSLLLPVMLAARKLARDSAETFDFRRELQLGSVPNTVFRAVLAVERLLLRGGIDFPAGGSLLAVARATPEVGAG
jgi:SAM-dependent methyltransferase